MRISTLVVVAAAIILQGCGSRPGDVQHAAVAPDADAGVELASSAGSIVPSAKGRAQLWTENCPRCHNARPATFYTLREWEVAMHHMRVRCSLTAEEHRKIMEFFRASK
jgi:hypothetical protein